MLGLPDSDWAEPSLTSVEYRTIRSSMLESAATTKIVILDCCFSGQTIGAPMADPTQIADRVRIDSAYTFASAAREAALALPGEERTAFAGRLLRLLRDGVPAGSEFLTSTTWTST